VPETTLASSVTDAGVVDIKRILFVDDEQSLLGGLRDALWPYRHRWAMSFVTSGKEAAGTTRSRGGLRWPAG
jgi:hypothetical protein